MRVHCMDEFNISGRDYENVSVKNIYEAVAAYGRTEDTIELYDDNDKLIARATWPQGRKGYIYCDDESVGTPWERWHK